MTTLDALRRRGKLMDKKGGPSIYTEIVVDDTDFLCGDDVGEEN